MDYQTFNWTAAFRLEVAESPRGFILSDYEKAHIERLWQEELAARPSQLFNGQLLNFVSFEEERMVGEFIDYKFYLAQLRDPLMQPLLQIAPICISGMTLSGEKLLIGRRAHGVSQYPDAFEAVPSGGIDPHAQRDHQIDLLDQFERELWEETGISVTEIKRIRPFLIAHDLSTQLYEICAQIDVNYTVVSEERSPTEEYQEFIWVPRMELKAFIQKHESEFVPFSLYLLRYLLSHKL
jgi:8-oxo-dGTP pyrophosphatase MutT (NUDIX family)